MRLLLLYLNLILMILVSCEDGIKSLKHNEGERELKEIPDNNDNETLKIADDEDLKHGKMPILPPIILLDFANDLENSSSSGEEKSKRTVESDFGHGFGRNNFFTGKYNYYFPAGKTGTSVSIEESVSPFLPKTIIESVKSTRENPTDTNKAYGQNSLQNNAHQSNNDPSNNGLNLATFANRFPNVQPIYGDRAKLYKPSQNNYRFQTFGTTARPTIDSYTTSRPDYRNEPQRSNQNSYVTPKPNFQSNPYGNRFYEIAQTTQRPLPVYSTQTPPSYVTPTSPSYHKAHSIQSANGHVTPRPISNGPKPQRPPSTVFPSESSLAQFANLPRYTIENGVKYENKIVWKYPDGKVSQSPPTSYVNAYNEYLSKQKSGLAPLSSNYQGVASYEISEGTPAYQGGNFDRTSYRYTNYQPSQIKYQNQDNRHPTESFSNIHSKSPAQFPNDQPSRPSRPSQFVSSASLGSANSQIVGQQASQANLPIYETTFQGEYGQKTFIRNDGVATSPSQYSGLINDEPKILKDSYDSEASTDNRPLSKYAVNSPNPEYTYSTEPSIKNTTPSSSANLFTTNGHLSTKVLSKYSSEAQKYLTKVFTGGSSAGQSSPDEIDESTQPTPNYSTNYENLLNYNPSIAQYVRDPSSILRAQPTFIQAGNSLIPVIILRVDGAPPVRPKITPNINLKALLRQYLTQYARSVAQNSHYEIQNDGKSLNVPPLVNQQQDPLYELAQLAQSLTQYSQNPSITNHYAKQLEENLNKNSYENRPTASYETNNQDNKNHLSIDYGSKTGKQKIKSVQIIEDPRFTSYNVNS